MKSPVWLSLKELLLILPHGGVQLSPNVVKKPLEREHREGNGNQLVLKNITIVVHRQSKLPSPLTFTLRNRPSLPMRRIGGIRNSLKFDVHALAYARWMLGLAVIAR